MAKLCFGLKGGFQQVINDKFTERNGRVMPLDTTTSTNVVLMSRKVFTRRSNIVIIAGNYIISVL